MAGLAGRRVKYVCGTVRWWVGGPAGQVGMRNSALVGRRAGRPAGQADPRSNGSAVRQAPASAGPPSPFPSRASRPACPACSPCPRTLRGLRALRDPQAPHALRALRDPQAPTLSVPHTPPCSPSPTPSPAAPSTNVSSNVRNTARSTSVSGARISSAALRRAPRSSRSALRPSSVISMRITRRFDGSGARRTLPLASRPSTSVVTARGTTSSRSARSAMRGGESKCARCAAAGTGRG